MALRHTLNIIILIVVVMTECSALLRALNPLQRSKKIVYGDSPQGPVEHVILTPRTFSLIRKRELVAVNAVKPTRRAQTQLDRMWASVEKIYEHHPSKQPETEREEVKPRTGAPVEVEEPKPQPSQSTKIETAPEPERYYPTYDDYSYGRGVSRYISGRPD